MPKRSATVGRILLGTSGWDYPEWVGPVYPANRKIDDRLRFYTELFPIVEINSTFYRLPPVGVARSWVRRTPRAFRFAAKFPQTITHDLRLENAEKGIAAFRAVMEPLRESGKLVAALLQLPPSLRFDEKVVRAFYESLPENLPVAVEFRENSWRVPESIRLLREFGYAYVVVDEPLLPTELLVTAPFAYVRWHGHGNPVWYDYTYTPEELRAWTPKLQELAEKVETVYGFFNNHFRGDAPANARSLSELLALPPAPWAAHKLMP
jgi:uncharacterized protein YecE (DUF72 family)